MLSLLPLLSTPVKEAFSVIGHGQASRRRRGRHGRHLLLSFGYSKA